MKAGDVRWPDLNSIEAFAANQQRGLELAV